MTHYTSGSRATALSEETGGMGRFLMMTAVVISAGVSWSQQQITIDSQSAAKPFPHFWEKAFGSGRAILALRDSYRQDLGAVKQATDFQYVRFHGILDDEVGIYNEDARGDPVYNFS